MKRTAYGFALCYALAALLFAMAGLRGIPCMTHLGAAYYGALWPLSPLSVALDRDLYPIPAWACAPSRSIGGAA